MSFKKAAIVLAAGKGKRMKSDLPKVLHTIKNKPIINILVDTLVSAKFDKIVVVIGFKGDEVRKSLADYSVEFAIQSDQRGTGDAVKSAFENLADFEGTTLVAAGDVPFLSEKSIADLIEHHTKTSASATCLSAILENPSGYGRIIRNSDQSQMEAIVEDKDASVEQLKINEINTGTFCFENKELFESLELINNQNAQGEYYLTDVVKVLNNKKLNVSVLPAENPKELKGINSTEELLELEELFGNRVINS